MQVAQSRRIITCCKVLPSEHLAAVTIAEERSSGFERIDGGALSHTRRWSPPHTPVSDHQLTTCEEWAINCGGWRSEVWESGALKSLPVKQIHDYDEYSDLYWNL